MAVDGGVRDRGMKRGDKEERDKLYVPFDFSPPAPLALRRHELSSCSQWRVAVWPRTGSPVAGFDVTFGTCPLPIGPPDHQMST